jgi:hypothetical protein
MYRDVMEPIAFFASLGTAIGAYSYFMMAGKEYNYEDLFTRTVHRYRAKLILRRGFDEKRYNELLDTVRRYEKRVNLQRFARLAV